MSVDKDREGFPLPDLAFEANPKLHVGPSRESWVQQSTVDFWGMPLRRLGCREPRSCTVLLCVSRKQGWVDTGGGEKIRRC